MIGPTPQIQIEREGPTYRVLIIPPDALPGSWSRPSTYASHPVAALGAKIMGDALGWPVIDLTEVGG